MSDPTRGKSALLLQVGAAAASLGVACYAAVCYLRCRGLAAELNEERRLRQVERSGRIKLQQETRQKLNKESSAQGFQFKSIGKVESPFPDRRGTPRQPLLVPAASARIRFDKKLIQFEHFAELSEFSHVWVIFVFHENTNVGSDGQPPAKIRPPRLHGKKVGTLSTRSPHRPNPIGLSWCEIESVGSDYIQVRGVDLLHGTPVLDVKPYIPYDIVPSSLPLPMATDASGAPLQLGLKTLQVPAWIHETDVALRPVRFSLLSEQALSELSRYGNGAVCAFSGSAERARELIEQVLRQDVRGVHQGRGGAEPDSEIFMCRLDGLRVSFVTDTMGIEVVNIVRDFRE